MNEPRESAAPPRWSLRCPSCAEEVSGWEAFCEGCGTQLTPTAVAQSQSGPTEGLPVPPGLNNDVEDGSAVVTCFECGGGIDGDGYCEQCGAKAPSARDHFVENPASWVGGVCDRGVRRQRNEDALALSADPAPGSHAVLVVCDGVSTADDSDQAALSAARTARGVLVAHQPQGIAAQETRIQGLTASFVEAFHAANDAVIAGTAPDSKNAPSCTIAAAVVDGDLVMWGTLGDSRVYWLADHGPSRLLSVDDSMAQLNMAAGMSREEAESGPGSHAITRWLGLDAPDITPAVGHLVDPRDGWLLLCSDGLWNYASEVDVLETVFAEVLLANPGAVDPTLLAQDLVRWANTQGGKDNITVALARFGVLDGFPGHPPRQRETPIAPESSETTGHTGRVRPDMGTDIDLAPIAAPPNPIPGAEELASGSTGATAH